jgi:hypothetical protein
MCIGSHVHSSLLQRADEESATRRPVQAVLLQDAMPMPTPVDQGTGPLVQAQVQWVDSFGGTHTGETAVDGAPRAGNTVTVWVDRADQLVPPPTNASDATAAGYVTAGVVMFVSIAVLILIWYGVRQFALRQDCARWAREWSEVEPKWSGRAMGGSLS